MTDSESASERYTRLLRELAKAEEDLQDIHERYVASGSVVPGQPIKMPERILDSQGMNEIHEAEAVRDELQRQFVEARDNLYSEGPRD